MEVKLLHATPLETLVLAIRTCYDSMGNSDSSYDDSEFILGEKDKALIEQIIESGHTSTLEHLSFNFYIKDYSRCVLQEKSRHRIASDSEKSTRYCLKKMETSKPFVEIDRDGNKHYNFKEAEQYLVFTGIGQVDKASIEALENVRLCVRAGIPNDKTKYCVPDSFKTTCVFTINARSLINFLELRTPPRALWEIREMAYELYNKIPTNYKFIFENYIYKEEKGKE